MTPEEKASKEAADAQAKVIADAVSAAVAESQEKASEAQAIAISEAVDKAVADALSKTQGNTGDAAADKAKKKQQKVMHTRALNVSQSKEIVGFKPSEDHGSMVKGKIYPVSENVAEILELKELGDKVELPKKDKKK